MAGDYNFGAKPCAIAFALHRATGAGRHYNHEPEPGYPVTIETDESPRGIRVSVCKHCGCLYLHKDTTL